MTTAGNFSPGGTPEKRSFLGYEVGEEALSLDKTPLCALTDSLYHGTDAATAQRQCACETPDYYFLPRRPRAPADALGVRDDFPILSRRVNGRPLIWLDNAATSQKPRCVIDAVSRYYTETNSNVHRGAHTLSRQATDAYEEARGKLAEFIGAGSREEVVFVRGATEAINLVASSWGATNIRPGDEIVITELEHHSNIVPWQMLAQKTGAVLKAAPLDANGDVMLDAYERLFTPRTRIAAVTHVSNVLGTVNPVRQMADIAHSRGAAVLVDGAQAVPHLPVNVRDIDADFYAFSGHKMYGPMGVGVLYGKKALLETMPPYQGGGGMIRHVRIEGSEYQNAPAKFEAGTGSIADAIALGAAADYLTHVGMPRISAHEQVLTQRLMSGLAALRGVRIIGTPVIKAGVVTFVTDMPPETVAQKLDAQGIAVRAGHHCAQPALLRYGLTSAVRASLGMYNTAEEVDALIQAVAEMR
jgi:cysteine desulfurase/selenocysteine lyase